MRISAIYDQITKKGEAIERFDDKRRGGGV